MAFGISPDTLALSPSVALQDEARHRQEALEARRIRLAEKRLMLENARATRAIPQARYPSYRSQPKRKADTGFSLKSGDDTIRIEKTEGPYRYGQLAPRAEYMAWKAKQEERDRSFEEKLALKRAGKTKFSPKEVSGWEEKGWAFGPGGKTIAPKAPKKPTLADKKREDIKTVFLRAAEGGQFKTQEEAYSAAVGEKISEDVRIKEAIMSLPPKEEDISAWFKPWTWGAEPSKSPSPYGEEAEGEAVGGEDPRFPAAAQSAGRVPEFNSEEEAEAANLPEGTLILINGRRVIVE